jgi:hypothetical protein
MRAKQCRGFVAYGAQATALPVARLHGVRGTMTPAKPVEKTVGGFTPPPGYE